MPGKELCGVFKLVYMCVCVCVCLRDEREKKNPKTSKLVNNWEGGGGTKRNAEQEQKQDLCVNHGEQHGMDTMWTERLVCLRLLCLHIRIKHPSGELDGSTTWLSQEVVRPRCSHLFLVLLASTYSLLHPPLVSTCNPYSTFVLVPSSKNREM